MENNKLNYNAPRERVKYAKRRGIAFEVLSEDVYDYVALRMILQHKTLSNALEWVANNTKGMLWNFTVITPKQYDEVAEKVGARYRELESKSRNQCKKLLDDINTTVKVGDLVKYKNAGLPKQVVDTTEGDFINDPKLTRITNAQRAVDNFGAYIVKKTE